MSRTTKMQIRQKINMGLFILIVITVFWSGVPAENQLNQDFEILNLSNYVSAEVLSKYDYENNLTYQIECNYSIWTVSTPNPIMLYVPRIRNNTFPDDSTSAFTQISTVIQNLSNINDFSGSTYIYDENDDYNNSYDCYEMNLLPNSQEFNYYTKYNVTLRETDWNIVEQPTIDAYLPLNSENWYLNLTGSQSKFDVDDPDLINLSNEIRGSKTSIFEISKAIHEYVVSNIQYLEQETDKGALQTYLDQTGDCSDYSSLMVTLLRIQGIPARRVIGMGFLDSKTDRGIYNSITNDTWEYIFDNDENTFPLHAWLEYWVPGYGFILCDPTWDMYNEIDYIHLLTTKGSNYGGGLDLPLPLGVDDQLSEFPAYPMFLAPPATFSNLRWNFEMKITVVDSPFVQINYIPMIIGGVAVVCVIAIVSWTLSIKKKNN